MESLQVKLTTGAEGVLQIAAIDHLRSSLRGEVRRPGDHHYDDGDVIVALSSSAVRAARQATRSIPIVAFDLESDPVAKGWVRGRAGTSRASSSICRKSALTRAALDVHVVCSPAWL